MSSITKQLPQQQLSGYLSSSEVLAAFLWSRLLLLSVAPKSTYLCTAGLQPMGKVGQVFHPEQDRIVSVRECARAQVGLLRIE